jgi:hypothetical protein
MTTPAETSRVNDLEYEWFDCQMQPIQSMTGPIRIKHVNGINVLDRRLCVAPMMDWTD